MCRDIYSDLGRDDEFEKNKDMKKSSQTRRPRIPKRGPGVAELEKILKEQEGKGDSSMLQKNELLSSSQSSSFLFNNHHPSPPPPSQPLWTPVSRPRTAVSMGSLGCGGGVSEKALFPTTMERSKSDSAMNFASYFSHIPLPTWSNNLEYFPSMVNCIQGSTLSSSSALSSSSSARLIHQIEHPSSQRSTHYNYLQEEEKMINAKRLRPYSMEGQMDPNLHSKAPIFPNMAMKESSSSTTSTSSSLEMNQNALFNWDLKGTNLRDTKRRFPHQFMSSTKCNTDKQVEPSNFITSTQSIGHEFEAFNFFASQEKMEDSQQRGGEASGSDYKKTLSLVFESKEKMGSKETSIGSYKEKAEAEGDDIDLNLKL